MKKTQQKADEDYHKGMDEANSIPIKLMKSFSPYGAFQVKDLKREGILLNFKMNGRSVMPVYFLLCKK